MLYMANTFGAVAGSIVTGFVLLPILGLQGSATALMIAAAAAALSIGGRKALAIPIVAIGVWMTLPRDFLLSRALLFPMQRAYAISEGVTELVAVTDGPAGGRVLVTNGHPMSSTELLSQRYMRAMAHIPLLQIDNPERVLVLCFGVGNTAHAATLHPTVKRVEVVDLSRHILDHAGYFTTFNGDVLHDPRVAVYINDGRHHLQMETDPYDLITLEPPPIVHAGVAALYTTEFYERARARLKPKGYISQWLPAFGVPQSMILSMVRSFIDVFPNAVLLSGASSNLLLVGTTDARNEIDPARLVTALRKAPAVQMDLQRLDLGTARDIVGMFVAAAETLRSATRGAEPVTDDRPIQEYGRKSLLPMNEPIHRSIIDVEHIAIWCPSCFAAGKPVPVVEGLDTYLSVLKLAYTAPPVGPGQTVAAGADQRPIAGSGYLGTVVPQSSQLDSILNAAFVDNYARGTDLLVARRYPDAIDELRAALKWNPDSAEAHNNLGIALASMGRMNEAVNEFRQALVIDPAFNDARRNLAMATRR
jgi:spermidine synthase